MTGPVAGQQYVSISGLGPQNHTVNLTANFIVDPDNYLQPGRWASAKYFNNETLMIEDFLNMEDLSDSSTLEYGYNLRSRNTTVTVECDFSDDMSLNCPDSVVDVGNFTVKSNLTSQGDEMEAYFVTWNRNARGIYLQERSFTDQGRGYIN